MSGYEQGGWQKADARVLGQILASQNIVFALPNITRITEYYAQTLISIPGIAACRVCLGNKSAQAGEMAVSVCTQCEILLPRTEEDNPISPASPGFKCILADQPDMRFMVVDSYQHRFGFFVLRIKDTAVFDVYQPFIVNLASYLALTLENRWQKKLLQNIQAELERKVEERTHDLLNANEELIASRRVALDMMQNAIEARQQAEQANAVLQREIAHRKQVEEALRQQYSTLRGIIDSTNAIIFSVDRQYRYTSFNQEHAAVMQALYDAEIEIGRNLLECMTVAEDREVAKRNLDRALAGERLVQESYSGEEPRSRRYFQISHSPVKTETGDIIGVAVLAQDITERREMEQALAMREREYRTLVEHSPDLIVRYNTDLRRIYVNPAWEKASGLHSEEVINVLPAEIPKVPKPTVTEYVEKLQEVLKTGSPRSIEFNWVNARSVTLYLDYVIVPEYDQYGEITSVLSVGRDLTERRRAEEALRESEEKYRSLIQKVQTAIVLHDGQGRILICNPLAQRLLGLSEDYLLGKSLDEPAWRFLREDGSVMPVSEYPVSLVLSSRQPLRGYVAGISQPNGKVWTLVNAEPEFTDSGDISQVIVSFIDITEKKRAEELLRKLSRAVEQSPVSIIITDTTGAIEYVNPRFTELTGYTLEEALGQNPNILKSDQTSPEEYDDLWKTIMSGGVWQGEFCNKKKNGELYWEWASISPVINHAGAITNFVAAKENITDRKRAEEAELRRRRIAETLVKAAGVLNSTLDLNQVLDLILQQLSRAIDCDSASFLEREGDDLVISACQGFHKPHEVLGARFSLSPNTPLDHVFSSKIPFHVADVDQEYPHFHDQDIASHYIRTWLGVPILSKDRVIGVVTLDRLEVRPFTDEDIELAMAFANQSAIAIENAALHKQTQHYAEELERRVEERTLDLRQEILERRRAEEALRESEARHRIVAELMSDYIYSIVLHHSDGTVETGWMSGAVERITGYTAEEIRDLPGGWNSIILPDGLKGFVRLWPSLLSGQTVVHEYRISTKSGDVRWLRDYKKPVWSESEKRVILIWGGVQDITERKQAEEALRERTLQLEAANEDLRILSRVKDDFVSNVSHELRTPITSLKLRHYLLAKQPDEWKTHLDILSRETERLHQIIESLLYLSRLDQGRVDWDPTNVDLNRLVAQFTRDRTTMAQSRDLSLSFTGEPDLPFVQADAALWEQALSILLTNAFNYTPAGGHVEVRTQVCERDGQRWVGVSVSDTGPGIAPDEQSHLFERFFRGSAGRESGTPGTGLGLSIVREIVNKHEGRVEVFSEGIPGKGTTFTLWLPA